MVFVTAVQTIGVMQSSPSGIGYTEGSLKNTKLMRTTPNSQRLLTHLPNTCPAQPESECVVIQSCMTLSNPHGL